MKGSTMADEACLQMACQSTDMQRRCAVLLSTQMFDTNPHLSAHVFSL